MRKRKIMLIRKYEINDKNKIEHIGKLLHDNYTFNLDDFSKCLVIIDDNKNPEGILHFQDLLKYGLV